MAKATVSDPEEAHDSDVRAARKFHRPPTPRVELPYGASGTPGSAPSRGRAAQRTRAIGTRMSPLPPFGGGNFALRSTASEQSATFGGPTSGEADASAH